MGGCIRRIHFEVWVKAWTTGADIVLIDADKRGQMLRFEFRMRISIIQDAFSAAESLLLVAVLNSLGCDAQLGAEYSVRISTCVIAIISYLLVDISVVKRDTQSGTR